MLAEGRDEYDFRIGRMDADLRDVLRRCEADVRPGLARVRRFVNAIARHDVAADAALTHSDENDVRVCLTDGDCTDGSALDLTIGHGRPGLAAIHRLPESTADGAEVRFLRP